MQTHIDLAFGDGTYRFRLPLPQINEVQRKTGLGIGAHFAKLLQGRYQTGEGEVFGLPTEATFAVADVVEPIRHGLIGGGIGWIDGAEVKVTPDVLNALMETYVYPARPLSEAWGYSVSILMACVEGYEEPNQKKSAPKVTPKRKTRKAGSTTRKPLETSPSPDTP